MIGFGEALARFYSNFVEFDGRASRAEYWWPMLMQTLVYIGLIIAGISLLAADSSGAVSGDSGPPSGFLALFGAGALFYLINIIPNIAVSIRRFHDLDQSGWLVLVFAIANAFIAVTVFAQMIWFALSGTDGPNKYGPDPYGYNPEVFG